MTSLMLTPDEIRRWREDGRLTLMRPEADCKVGDVVQLTGGSPYIVCVDERDTLWSMYEVGRATVVSVGDDHQLRLEQL